MSSSAPARVRPAVTALVFVVLSLLMHLALWLVLFRESQREPHFELSLPDQVEFGIAQPTPEAGAQGSPPPAPASAPKAPPERRAHAQKPAKRDDDSFAVAEGAQKPNTAANARDDDARGEGEGSGSSGAGLGFGAGGFGSGAGEGVIIGLHADIDRIRSSSLVLETRALLSLIPEWEKLLKGSGIEPLKHLSRVFVATPNLKRSELVLSARFKGAALVRDAAERLAQERGKSASFETRDGLETAPWFSRGPTEREVALVGPSQFVIARPRDVPRVLAVSTALARRQQKQAEMEQAEGAGALLAMYTDEAAALSVENARKFVSGDNAYVPLALRISLSALDEYHAKLRVFGYYENNDSAGRALGRIDALRHELALHKTVQYFGLQSAIDEAHLTHDGDTLRLDTVVTLHQTRYLMAFVRKALAPRDAPEPSAEPTR